MFNVWADVNWLMTVVAVIGYFALGGFWFTPLFGRAYDTATGITREKGAKWPAVFYVGPLVGCALLTVATAVIAAALDVQDWDDAVMLGLLAGIIAAAVSLTNAITPNMPKPLTFAAVTGSYHVAGSVLVAVVVTI